MPTRMPVVNGTERRPASSMVLRRTAGSLSGDPKCTPPFWLSRSEEVSSIMPMDALTCLSRAMSSHVITPGLRCGSSPVSSMTRIDTARRYSRVLWYPRSASHCRAMGYRSSGLSPSRRGTTSSAR